jgi:hypothetical protein
MLPLYVGRALDAVKILNLCVERSKKIPWLNGYTKHIFRPNLTEEFKYIAFVLKEKFGECWQTPTQKIVLGSILCCHDKRAFGPNVLTFTCWQLSQPRLTILDPFDMLFESYLQMPGHIHMGHFRYVKRDVSQNK